jgi:hypothetical protein
MGEEVGAGIPRAGHSSSSHGLVLPGLFLQCYSWPVMRRISFGRFLPVLDVRDMIHSAPAGSFLSIHKSQVIPQN